MGGSACTDAAPTFTYTIDMTPIIHLGWRISMYVDLDNKKVQVKSYDGSEYGVIYTLTVVAYLPFDDSKTSFTFQFVMNTCKDSEIEIPSFPDQIYYVSDSPVSYTAPAFDGTNSICQAGLAYIS